ncbi:MAG: hypothetical protein K9L78_03855 [Victivallales bacterium]|nr:hypothetical protein [Victivallales bacterium]MCF7889235.1 hypothetical protein [Victivallales bacterium]
MKKLIFFLLFIFVLTAFGGSGSVPRGTLKIYNHWSGKHTPNVYLYMNYSEADNLKFQDKTMDNQTYYKLSPKTNAFSPALITWNSIDSGNLSFCTFSDNTPPSSDDTDTDPVWSMNGKDNLSGFIEFTQLITDKKITCDLSNVDGIGLLCGLGGLPKEQTESGKAGYAKCQTNLIAGIQNLKQNNIPFPNDALIPVKINGTVYNKVIAPGKSPSKPWKDFIGTYYDKVLGINLVLKLSVADNGGVKWTGNQYSSGKIIKGITKKGKPVKIAVELHSTYTLNSKKYNWSVYIVKDVWNRETINKADTDGGLYIRTNYPLPSSVPGFYHDGKQYGVNDRHINWKAVSGSDQPVYCKNVTALLRDLMVGFQLGKVNPEGTSYTSPSDNTPVYKYGGNLYNKFIMDNSDSYGNPYSDNAANGGQVLYNPKSSFSLHILSPNDPDTGKWYQKNKSNSNQAGKYLLGIPSTLGKATVNGNPYTPNGFNSSAADITFSAIGKGKILKVNFINEKIKNPDDWTNSESIEFNSINKGKQTLLALPANLSWAAKEI